MVKIVGITGLVACGKSTLTNYLRSKNFKVFDADFESKQLYTKSDFLNTLRLSFPTVFDGDIFDKKILANIVFSNKQEKKKLENLIHPIIEKKCDEFIKNNINEKIIFLDIPLLFEVNWNKKCSDVILIIADKEIQKERFLERGGDAKIFDKIIENQGNVEEKVSKSNYVLENNHSLSEFYGKIDNILENIKY